MKLSILIPTTNDRAHYLNRLLDVLYHQNSQADDFEIVIEDTDIPSTGAKRNRLLARAYGEFVVFIDDDDLVPSDYCTTIIDAINQHDPDAIGFYAMYYEDRKPLGECKIHLNCLRYRQIFEPQQQRKYLRPLCHLNPMRRTIAQQVRFPDASFGEDHAWASGIRPLIQSHYFIPQVLYHYFYRSNKREIETPEQLEQCRELVERTSWRQANAV